MNIQATKLELVRMILDTDNITVLESIKKIFDIDSKEDFWNLLTDEQRMDIERGIKDIDNGDTIELDAFVAKHT